MAQTILLLLLLGAVAIVIYLATLKGAYQVRRKNSINAAIDTVFDKLRDFKTWSDWSPWLIHEPDCQLTFSDRCDEEGGSYTWDGKRIGAGTLAHVTLDRPHHIEQRLTFTRPFKSVCDVGFELREADGSTDVTWTMRGKMPFLLRFMTEKTVAMIEKDYDLGLAMLAGILDPAAETPKLEFKGVVERSPHLAVCKGFEGTIEAIAPAMQSGFPELVEYLADIKADFTGRPFAAYHKIDPKTRAVVCDMAMPVSAAIDAGPHALKELGGGKYFHVTLKGSYRFLELAWYSATAHVQMQKLKVDGSRPWLEVYENDPDHVEHSNEILTTLLVPIK